MCVPIWLYVSREMHSWITNDKWFLPNCSGQIMTTRSRPSISERWITLHPDQHCRFFFFWINQECNVQSKFSPLKILVGSRELILNRIFLELKTQHLGGVFHRNGNTTLVGDLCFRVNEWRTWATQVLTLQHRREYGTYFRTKHLFSSVSVKVSVAVDEMSGLYFVKLLK